jgi:hypothetical protein
VRHHDDRPRRTPDRFGDEVLHLDAAVPGDDGAEALAPDGETVRLELVAEPLRCGNRAREPVRMARDEVGRELLRRRAVELRQEGARERRRTSDAEGRDQQRQSDEQPCAAVEPPVHGPLDGAWTRPATLDRGRNAHHPGL